MQKAVIPGLATEADFEPIWRRAQSAAALALDTEGTGLDWRKDQSVGYVLTFSADPADTFYLPFRHGGGGNLDQVKVLKLVRNICRLPKLKIIGFNLAFDLKFMHNDGVTVAGPMEDAQINASLVDERQRSFSLDACCRFMKVTEKKGAELYKHIASQFGGEPVRSQMGNFWRLAGNDPIAVDYAAGDGTSTWHLWEAQQKVLDDQELRRVWSVECRVIRVLHRMTMRGVKVDEERLAQIAQMVDERYERLMGKLPKDFNSKAPTQLKKLFTDAGITNWPTTPTGLPSFNQTWLNTNPLGQDIVAVRKLRHLKDSFLTPMIERHLYKGRVHPNYNQTRGEDYGTITGRLSCNDPNLQAVHKRNEELGSIFRSIFIPDAGKNWASGDYSQCEPRLLAHYGSVQVLLRGYMSKPYVDAHTSVASAAFADGGKPTKDQREMGKRLNQALITGAGRAKAASMLDKPMKEANKMVDDYFGSMPEIPKLQKHAANVMRMRGYVKSLLNRRARLESYDFAYLAVNRLLQCGNADIIKKAMADIDEYYESEGDRVNLLNNVHDDLCHQYAPEDRKIFERGIELMEDFGPGRSVEITVPMVVDVGEGDSWAVATYGEEKVKKVFKDWGSSYER